MMGGVERAHGVPEKSSFSAQEKGGDKSCPTGQQPWRCLMAAYEPGLRMGLWAETTRFLVVQSMQAEKVGGQ
jgi:hypothetical protein